MTEQTHSPSDGEGINIPRLGSQQKDILRFLYELDNEVRQQVDIIEALYDDVTDTRKASVSRSISKLREAGVMYEQNSLYYPLLEAWCKARPRYGLTEGGERFLERDTRFPDIEGDATTARESDKKFRHQNNLS